MAFSPLAMGSIYERMMARMGQQGQPQPQGAQTGIGGGVQRAQFLTDAQQQPQQEMTEEEPEADYLGAMQGAVSMASPAEPESPMGIAGGDLGGWNPQFMENIKQMMAAEDEGPTQQDKGLALARMGFGIAASENPSFMGAVGEGAVGGIDTLDRLRRERAVQRMRQAQVGVGLLRAMKPTAGKTSPLGQMQADRDALIQQYGERDPRVVELTNAINKAGGPGEKERDFEAKINAILDANPGMPRQLATNIVNGVVGVSRDPVNGSVQYYNLASMAGGSPSGGGVPAPQPGPSGQTPPPNNAPKAVPLFGAVEFLGGKEPIQEQAARLTVGGYDPGQSVNLARQNFRLLRQDIYDMKGGVARMSENERKDLNQTLPSEGVFESPAREYDKLLGWHQSAADTIAEQTAVRDNANLAPEVRKDADARIIAAQRVLRKLGDPSKHPRPESGQSNLNVPRPDNIPEGYRRAGDGKYYKPNPSKPGGYLMWVPGNAGN